MTPEQIQQSIEGLLTVQREVQESHIALTRDVAQLVATQQDAMRDRQELREAMIRLADTQEGIARLLANLDEDRPTILRKLNTIENKVDSLLQRQSDEP